MTSGSGRLLPDIDTDCVSREVFVVLEGVPRSEPGPAPLLGVTVDVRYVLLGPSDTTRSSSSTKLVSCDPLRSSLRAPGTSHLPSGSIVTCSTDSDVSTRISRTYLASS